MDDLAKAFKGSALTDEKLLEILKKLDSGAGTYKEVSKIAQILGDKVARELVGMFTEDAFMSLSEASHDIVEECCESAQTNLNAAAGIGLAAKRNKFPRAKFQAAAARIAAADDVDGMLRVVSPTTLLSAVDDTIRYNADFQRDAGMKPIIVRTWSGSYPSHDTKHTDWCHDLAGTYEYGTEPKEVYARHDGCRCTVEYFPNKQAQGRITALAKGQVDVNGVLWNTKAETLEKRLRKAAK